ncbi:hypothetical protein Ancab_024302 [Ancistrocladus abbreviatus]
MEEDCAVCAERLKWVAYGPCGHREACATCTARLRFVCSDRRCCICKSDAIFVFNTKALGNSTRMINDFSIFPVDAKGGKVGSFWYHEDTRAYFDDLDQYNIIKAMCKLSCSACDKLGRNPRRKGKFRNIEHLKGHLLHEHELFMCELCLESRKVFICEQKLYSRSQLKKHTQRGDPVVDGSKRERCGFSGHPLCKFCQTPFYGDIELYFHLCTEHFTCHICQREHPDQYVYYKNYDELENHFRGVHFLCEDDSCLEKKFTVFVTEAEVKRHYALEHGGNVPRPKCTTAFQIPVGVQYPERQEESHPGRRRGTHRDSSNHPLSLAGQASVETASQNMLHEASSSIPPISPDSGMNETGSTAEPVDSLLSAEPELPMGHSLATDSRNGLQEESAFPPLPRSCRSRVYEGRIGCSTMAVRLHRRSDGSLTVFSLPSVSAANCQPSPSARSFSQARVMSRFGLASTFASTISSQSRSVAPTGSLVSNSKRPFSRSMRSDGLLSISSANSVRLTDEMRKIGLSSCAPNLLYRQYLAYVQQFGIFNLLFDLARLCPEPQKLKELLEIPNANQGVICIEENHLNSVSENLKARKGSAKGKEKCQDNGDDTSRDSLAVTIANFLKEMKPNDETLKGVSLKDENCSADKKPESSLVDGATSSVSDNLTSTELNDEEAMCYDAGISTNFFWGKERDEETQKELRVP